jgi:hypothetical protein
MEGRVSHAEAAAEIADITAAIAELQTPPWATEHQSAERAAPTNQSISEGSSAQ